MHSSLRIFICSTSTNTNTNRCKHTKILTQGLTTQCMGDDVEDYHSPGDDEFQDSDTDSSMKEEDEEAKRKRMSENKRRSWQIMRRFKRDGPYLARVKNALVNLLQEINPTYGDWITSEAFETFVIHNSSRLQELEY